MTGTLPSLGDIASKDLGKVAAAIRGHRQVRDDDGETEEDKRAYRLEFEARLRAQFSGAELERRLAGQRQLWRDCDALKRLTHLYLRTQERRDADAQMRQVLTRYQFRISRIMANYPGHFDHRSLARVRRDMKIDQERAACGEPSLQEERDAAVAAQWRRIRESVKPRHMQDADIVKRKRGPYRKGAEKPAPLGYRSETVLRALFAAGHSDEVIAGLVEMPAGVIATLRARLMAAQE